LIFTALLTAYYTFRAYFRTFWGPLKVPASAGVHGHDDEHHHEQQQHEHHGEAHESPAIMTIPLIVLAIGAVVVGGLLWMNHNFAHFLGRSIDFAKYYPQVEHHPDLSLMIGSGVVAFLGIGLAYWLHVRSPESAQALAARFPRFHRWSQHRFYFDELYGWIAVGPLTVLAVISKVFDLLVDGIVDLVGRFPKNVGSLFRPIQNGLVQFYALAMVLGLAVFLFFMARQ
jgi:NADH-quinone oxidoreductase subunit L